MDLAIHPATGDLFLADNGDAAVVRDDAAVVQDLRSRLRFFLGEWFLDKREGVPYFRELLGVRNPSTALLTSIFRRVILETAGIAAVLDLAVVFDPRTRELRLDFSARLAGGGVVSTRNDGPFVVEV